MKTHAERRFHLQQMRHAIPDDYTEEMVEMLTPLVYGLLAQEIMGLELELQVLRSAAGWYIGTFDAEDGPISRESWHYYATKAEAQAALDSGNWVQRYEP